MPKAGDDIVICVGRESIEALATGSPVKVGDNEYLLKADSYDYPYRRIAELEAEVLRLQRLNFSQHPFGESPVEVDVEAFLNMRNWLEAAVEARGAKFTGGGIGCGQADIDIVLEEHHYNISIRPMPNRKPVTSD